MKFPKLEQTAAALVVLAGAVMFGGGSIAASLPQSSEDLGIMCMFAGALVGVFGLFSLWRAGSEGL